MAGPLAPRPRPQTFLGSQSGGAGALVGDAFRKWNGAVAGGAFASPEEARLSRTLNAVAVRKRAQQQRGALAPRGPRTAVTGGMSVSIPATRA